MKKGLTITLLTVAIAMIGYQAMAEAPVIGSIPSPIVGSGDVTAATKFVYPDAINLDQYVTDDTSATAKILWSYEESGTKYILNGIDPINDTDPSTIEYNPGPKNIAANVGGSEMNPDGNTRTVTIRNKDLSPLTGTGAAPGANGANNVIPAETATITLTASDGSSFSQKDLVIFSDNGGQDRLSGDFLPGGGEIVYHPNLGSSTKGGFTFAQSSAPYDPVTQSSPSGQICMEGAALGNNQGMWVGTAGDFPLAGNSVYDIQMTMTGSNAAPGHTPFWDIFLDNNNNTGSGLNLYGADAYYFDNEGGANAAVQAEKVFHMIWTPLCVGSAAFTTEAFSTTNAPLVKGRFVFRMMDIWNNGAGIPNANIQSGTVCLKDLTVIKYPIGGVKVVGSAIYDKSTFTYSSGAGVAGDLCTIELAPGALAVSTAGGGFTVTPSTAGRSQAYTTFYPGDTNNDYANPSTQADNFPVPIDANTIYRTTYTIAAVDSNSATNPPDALFICAETPSNEAIQQNYVTSNLLSAMPKTTASPYISFYHTNFGTNTSVGAAWKRFRPSLIVCNLTSLGGSANNNSGAIKISNVKVEKVTLY